MKIIRNPKIYFNCRIYLEKRKEKQLEVIKRMPQSFYRNKLKIAPKDIPHFIDFCESENDLDELLNISIIEFIELLEETAILYKKIYPNKL